MTEPRVIFIASFLDELKAAWNTDSGWASEELRPHEAEIVHYREGERYLRLATGGKSENEETLERFREERPLEWAMTWCLSTRGGLHIFKYPPHLARKEKKQPKQGQPSCWYDCITETTNAHDIVLIVIELPKRALAGAEKEEE